MNMDYQYFIENCNKKQNKKIKNKKTKQNKNNNNKKKKTKKRSALVTMTYEPMAQKSI
jgi:hypothetical protein